MLFVNFLSDNKPKKDILQKLFFIVFTFNFDKNKEIPNNNANTKRISLNTNYNYNRNLKTNLSKSPLLKKIDTNTYTSL